MRVLYGDLLEFGAAGTFDVIVHGCNCFGAMGAGIAKSIAARFPIALAADQATPRGDAAKLGAYSKAVIDCEGHALTVVNAYTQFHGSSGGVDADYKAIRAAFAAIRTDFSGSRIGYPRIGAGLAGGDWPTIAQIIEEELTGEDHGLVEFRPFQ